MRGLMYVYRLTSIVLTDVYEWLPFGTFSDSNETNKLILDAPKTIAGWSNFPPKQSPACGFFGELCPKPDDKSKETDCELITAFRRRQKVLHFNP